MNFVERNGRVSIAIKQNFFVTMENKNWSLFIPKEKLGIQKNLEVEVEIPQSELLSDSLTLDELIEKIADVFISNGVFSNRKEVGNE